MKSSRLTLPDLLLAGGAFALVAGSFLFLFFTSITW